MRRILLGTFAWLAAVYLPFHAQAAGKPAKSGHVPEPLKVLFIGNSYTYYNNLPDMLAGLAGTTGSPRRIQAKMVAVQDATLQMHWESGAARQAIRERKWDFVVLQEQSLRPVEDTERMVSYARRFNTEIRRSGARTVLFLTWARRDKPEMQLALNDAYLTLAEELRAGIAPVGPAWQAAFWYAPTMALHMEDGSHPTPTGTYLTACVFYLALLGNQRSCPALEHAEISPEDAAVARTAAAHALAAH